MIKRMEDWEWEAWNDKYEAFERFIGRFFFWAIVIIIIGALVFNAAILTMMMKEMIDSRSWHPDQVEARTNFHGV